MAEKGWYSETFVALNTRLLNKQVANVLTGGWALIEFPEKQAANPRLGVRPYAVILPKAVRNTKYTNKTKYADVYITFEIHSDTFDQLDRVLIPAVVGAFENLDTSKLVVGDGTLKVTMIRPGDIEYDKIEQIWMAGIEFLIQANQPASATPS